MLSKLLGGGASARRPHARGSFENPNIPFSDPEAWGELFGDSLDTVTGEPMSDERALRLAAVWQAVSMISGGLARMPLRPYKIDGSTREIYRTHPAYRLVYRQANRERTAVAFWRMFYTQAALHNVAYAFIHRAEQTGRPKELVNLLHHHVRPERKGGELRYLVTVAGENGATHEEPVRAADMLVVHGPQLDPLEAPDMVHKARDTFAVQLAAEQYEGNFFKNGNRPGGFLMIPSHFSEPAADNLEVGFRKQTAGRDNWFRTVILREGAKYERNQFSFAELEATALRDARVADVARWFNVAPSRLGLKDSTSYNSKAEDNRDFLDTTLSPWMAAAKAELWLKLLSPAEQSAESVEFDFDTTILLALNPKDQAQVDALRLRNRIAVPNEIRARDGLAPIEGGDDPISIGGAKGGGQDGGADKQPADGSSTKKGDGGMNEGAGDGAVETNGATIPAVDIAAGKGLADLYALAVRSGAVTPQPEDEEYFRQAFGLPAVSDAVRAVWMGEPTRRPVTLAAPADRSSSAGPPPGDPVDDPEADPDEPPGDEPPPEPPPGDEERGARLALSRILFRLTGRLRHKAARGTNALVEFIDGGLQSFRREAAELVGDDHLVVRLHEDCRQMLETVTASEMVAAVESLCTKYEEELA